MKKKLVKIAGMLISLFLIIGAACCILRPEYTKEALGILFENEIDIDEIESE